MSIFRRLKRKCGKWLVKSGVTKGLRIAGLRICGMAVGQQVYIGEELIIIMPVSESNCTLNVGNRVSIAPRVTIILGSDPNYSILSDFFGPVRGTVSLEDDCWIGAGAIIQPNVTIARGSVIGAGSVVTKNTEPFTVYSGVPAKMMYRLKTSPSKELAVTFP